MSISWLSLLVELDGPAIIGVNLISLVFVISIYSDFYFSVTVFICLDIWIFGSS